MEQNSVALRIGLSLRPGWCGCQSRCKLLLVECTVCIISRTNQYRVVGQCIDTSRLVNDRPCLLQWVAYPTIRLCPDFWLGLVYFCFVLTCAHLCCILNILLKCHNKHTGKQFVGTTGNSTKKI